LLTALRVWVSLPDEVSEPSTHRARVEREPLAPSCHLPCQCSVQRVTSARAMTVYQQVVGVGVVLCFRNIFVFHLECS
jgi:hypothetical protein